MKISAFTKKSLVHNKKSIFFIVLAIALSTAVLSGAIFLGDSVKITILTLGQEKLGNSQYIVSTNDINLFLPSPDSEENPGDFKLIPMLKLPGSSLINERGLSIEHFRAYAVGSSFFRNYENHFELAEVPEGKAVINEYLAGQLHVKEGDTVQFRSGLFSDLSPSFSFYRENQEFISKVTEIYKIIPNRGPGRFSTSVNQGVEALILFNLNEYQELLSRPGKANLYLASSDYEEQDLSETISTWYNLSDIGMKLDRYSDNWNILESDQLFISPKSVSELTEFNENIQPVFSYFLNSADREGNTSPFHFITALPESYLENDLGLTLEKGEAYINPWLKEDLKIDNGSIMNISYYITGKNQTLETANAAVKIKGTQSQYLFRKLNGLVPDFPGLAGKESCLDWDPGIPVNLDNVRAKDEEYWDIWKFTPKILISYSFAAELWADNNASATALLIPSSIEKEQIENLILSGLSAEQKGFFIDDHLARISTAGGSSINFSELFLGLSFLLMAAALFLLVFIIQIFYKNRQDEIILLKALGFTKRKITFLYIKEVFLFTLPGAILGIGLGLLYNYILMNGLKTIWYEAARLDTVIFNLGLKSIFIGLFSGLLCNFAVSVIVITRIIKGSVTPVLKRKILTGKTGVNIITAAAAAVLLLIIILTLLYITGIIVSPVAYFFAAGGLMLVLFPLLAVIILKKIQDRKTTRFSGFNFSLKNISFNLSRTVSIILITSLSVFMIIAIGANKNVSGLSDSDAGTGGFELTLNTARPLSPQLRDWPELWKLPASTVFPIRIREGDEASCLNLNQVRNPTIAGIDPEILENENRFHITHEINKEAGWSVLDEQSGGNIIPAIADNGVLTWSLGLKTGDSLEIKAEDGQIFKLVFYSALSNSVFQGSVIISEDNFLKLFLSSKGYSRFLIDLEENTEEESISKTAETLERILRLSGPVVRLNSDILNEYYSVENTYITIFFQLGLIALVFAVAGISILLLRKIQDEKPEICIQKITGFSKGRVFARIFRENFIIITTGIFSGTVSALAALFPVFSEQKSLIIEYPLYAFLTITAVAVLLLCLFISAGLRTYSRMKPSSL